MHISKPTILVIKHLANLISIARKEYGVSIEELAERMDTNIEVVQSILDGDPNNLITAYFEACVVLGIPLIEPKHTEPENMVKLLAYMNPLIPEHVKNIKIDDDF